MRTAVYEALSNEQSRQIRKALDIALVNQPKIAFDSEKAMRRNDELLVEIHANGYPNSMFEFMQALADAEISLRDSGFKVRLIPDVPQRMIVVANVEGGPIAYCSTDGMEYRDLAKLLGIDEKQLANTEFVGYPYDSEDDFRLALQEAKQAFPSAEFSKVKFVKNNRSQKVTTLPRQRILGQL